MAEFLASPALVAVAAALLSSSVLGTVLSWLRDRKKDTAATESTQVTTLTDVVRALRAEVREAHEDAAAVREEMRALRAENEKLRRKLQELERRLPRGRAAHDHDNERDDL